jgi:hypothetical protein
MPMSNFCFGNYKAMPKIKRFLKIKAILGHNRHIITFCLD